MAEQWTWTYLDADGAEVSGEELVTTAFPTQSDAENWLGEVWRGLGGQGVESVVLHQDGEKVYGPMSLRAPQ